MDVAVIDGSNFLWVMQNDGAFQFSIASLIERESGFPIAIVAGNFDGDPHQDLAIANGVGHTIDIYLGRGDGTFITSGGFEEAGTTTIPIAGVPVAMIGANLRNDGRTQLVVAECAAVNVKPCTLDIFQSNSAGIFEAAQRIALPGIPGSFNFIPQDAFNIITSDDFDLDNKPDIAVGVGNQAMVFRNTSVFDGNADAHLTLLTILSAPAFAASGDAHSALPGTVNYIEGQVNIGSTMLNADSIGTATLEPNQTLETGHGKAEILLTPGVFLRVDNNSSVRMISPSITDTEVQLDQGRAMVEVAEIHDQNNLRVREDGYDAQLVKKGIYEFDADQQDLMVFSGKAKVLDGDRTVSVGGGKQLYLNTGATLKPHGFDKDEYKQSDLYQWSSLRATYLAEANVNAASVYAADGYYGTGWYGPGWYWAPAFGDYTLFLALAFFTAHSDATSFRRWSCSGLRSSQGLEFRSIRASCISIRDLRVLLLDGQSWPQADREWLPEIRHSMAIPLVMPLIRLRRSMAAQFVTRHQRFTGRMEVFTADSAEAFMEAVIPWFIGKIIHR